MAISNVSGGLRSGVCTSTTRPVAPYEGQQIYETDTDLMLVWNGSAWVEIASLLTKAPRGVMARSVLTSNVNFTAVADTGLSCTFTAESTRVYKISYSAFCSSNQAGIMFTYITNSSNTIIREMLVSVDVATGQTNHTAYTTVSGISGSVTYKIRALNQNGTGTIYGASPAGAIMLVEDIGAA